MNKRFIIKKKRFNLNNTLFNLFFKKIKNIELIFLFKEYKKLSIKTIKFQDNYYYNLLFNISRIIEKFIFPLETIFKKKTLKIIKNEIVIDLIYKHYLNKLEEIDNRIIINLKQPFNFYKKREILFNQNKKINNKIIEMKSKSVDNRNDFKNLRVNCKNFLNEKNNLTKVLYQFKRNFYKMNEIFKNNSFIIKDKLNSEIIENKKLYLFKNTLVLFLLESCLDKTKVYELFKKIYTNKNLKILKL